ECEHRSTLPSCNLGDDVRGRAETIETDLFSSARDHERAPPDQAGTEQRRECHVRAGLAERERKACIGDGCRRIAAVPCISREQRPIAEVLTIHSAIRADPT